ncbi:MAG: response regulator [Candidatus Zixiibacteriota bacterium]
METQSHPIRLLLVDDEEMFLLATSQALNRRGFTVSVAPNGVTALDKIAAEQFDIIVLDVKMPDIDGIEVFNQINSRHPNLPVIILTGHPSISDAFHTSKQGIASYMSKPVEIEELARKARNAVIAAKDKEEAKSQKSETPNVDEQVRVLIVDDEEELLSSLSRLFSRRQIQPLTANSGQRALEILQDSLVDIMVLDVKMPGMDGLEVLRRVKKQYPSIQVILLSGHPSVEAALEGVRLGAGEYLRKPPDIDELVKTIHRLFRRRREILETEQKKLIDDILKRYPN